jgi:dethiobiotin synthetase
MNMTKKNYYITGTDTEIGKTFAACAMIHAFIARNVSVAPMKPIAAGTINLNGVDVNEDVAALMAAAGNRFSLWDVNPYCFADSIAPHIAAKRVGQSIDMGMITAAYERLKATSDKVLVEGAGGFLVPMSATQSMAEIPKVLGLDVILVVGMRLGCINHATLTVEAIRARGLALAGWIANTPATQMAAYEENLATLKSMIDAPLLGTIPRIPASYLVSGLAATKLAAQYVNIEPLL